MPPPDPAPGGGLRGRPLSLHRNRLLRRDRGEPGSLARGENRIVKRSSPSRLRFRPPLRPTFRFRVQPPGLASSYSRSVLGAIGTLGPSQVYVKRAAEGI